MKIKKISILLLLFFLPIIIFISLKNNDPKVITDKIIKCSYQKEQKDRESCIKKYLTSDIKLNNYKSLITDINNMISSNISLKNNCHEISHYIGQSAFLRYKEKALTNDTPSCGEGYIHAIMGNFITTYDNIKKLVTFCATYPKNSKENALCYHGIGHSYAEEYNVTENNNRDISFINKLSKFCNQIKTIAIKKYQDKSEYILPGCFSGGYTQYFENINQQLENQNIYTPDPKNCNEINDALIVECFRISINYNILSRLDNDLFRSNKSLTEKIKTIDTIYNETSLYCKSLINLSYNTGCMRGIATSYVNAILSKNIIEDISKLKKEKIITLIENICKFDTKNQCKTTFINELKEKIDNTIINSIEKTIT